MMNSKKRKSKNNNGKPKSKRHITEDESNLENTEQFDGANENPCKLIDEQKFNNGGVCVSDEPSDSKNIDSPHENKESPTEVSEELETKDIKIDASPDAGTLLFSGGTNWDLVGRKQLPKSVKSAEGPNLWGPHRLSALKGIRVKFAASSCTACHSILVTEDGRVMTWGRNDKGQLGLGDSNRRDIPCVVEFFNDLHITSGACGRSHSLFLSASGVVYSVGDNKMGQCGIESQNNAIDVPKKVVFKGRPISKVACGADFSVIIDSKGGMYTFGCPEYGQLGHNSDGKYFVTSNKLSFNCELVPRRVAIFIEKTRDGHVIPIKDVRIADVACGINHSVAVDVNKCCYSWGFGGYGRLGHAEQKDELVPRLIKAFSVLNMGIKQVYAGGTHTLAVNAYDVLYFWGQTRKSGEATMYPKPVQDLVGWKVRQATCSNTSVVVIADDSLVSWGASPTYGELCYGETKPKSSTTPQEVKTLNGIVTKNVSCGYGHTLIIAKDETEEDLKKLERLPEFNP